MLKNKKSKDVYEDIDDDSVAVGRSFLPGIVVLIVGIAFLGMNLLNVEFDSFPWPLYIIIPGGLLLIPAWQLGPDDPPGRAAVLARIGAILMMIGLVTAFVEVVDHYESWAYAWTLVPVASIAARMFANRFEPDSSIFQTGPRLIRILLAAFVVLAIFFELVIFNGYGRWWPVLLVAVGGYLLVNPRR